MNWSAIYNQAVSAGKKAAHEYNAKLPPEAQRGLDCGFVWVTVHPAHGPFIAWCRANGKGDKGYRGDWQFWYYEFDDTNTQSIDVHTAAARAFAFALAEHGIRADIGSRMD